MTLTDLTTDWRRAIRGLKDRFPHINEREIARGPLDSFAITEHVARRHNLTRLEAEEELKDWLYVQSLARQASELEAR